MRFIFLIDLASLLPLILVGGWQALWWVVITAGIGVAGLLFSFGNIGSAVQVRKNVRQVASSSFSTMLALGSVLMLLPGLLSDMLGFAAIVFGLVIAKMYKKAKSTAGKQGRYQRTSTKTTGKKGRIVEAQYQEVKEDKKQA